MRSLPRLVLALIVVAVTTVLAVLYFSERSSPRRQTELDRLVERFMECLPEKTTPAAREEIRGILDRYRNKALVGDVHPLDAIEIENDLRSYIAAGGIPDSLIAGFMSKVGKATRRLSRGAPE